MSLPLCVNPGPKITHTGIFYFGQSQIYIYIKYQVILNDAALHNDLKLFYVFQAIFIEKFNKFLISNSMIVHIF